WQARRITAPAAPATVAPPRGMQPRILMPRLAAAIWLGIAVGSTAAAQASGPLYPTRMWVEAALLPTSAEARMQTEPSELDQRLAEVLAGVARGDRDAVAAALDAYGRIADEAITDSAGDPSLQVRVGEALDQH